MARNCPQIPKPHTPGRTGGTLLRQQGRPLYADADREHHQGDFGEAAVEALCIAAGLNTAKQRRDDGVDIIITKSGQMIPLLAAQVKTCRGLSERDGFWRYDLTASAFNRLSTAPAAGAPEYLFLANVPSDRDEYLEITESGLWLSVAVYWLSLEGMADGTKRTSSRRVWVPRDNLLTLAALAEMFDKAAEGRRILSPEEMEGGSR